MIPSARIPTHPGEVLREEFLKPHRLTRTRLARQIRMPPRQLEALLAGRLDVTHQMARQLARALRTTPEYRLNLMSACNLALSLPRAAPSSPGERL